VNYEVIQYHKYVLVHSMLMMHLVKIVHLLIEKYELYRVIRRLSLGMDRGMSIDPRDTLLPRNTCKVITDHKERQSKPFGRELGIGNDLTSAPPL